VVAETARKRCRRRSVAAGIVRKERANREDSMKEVKHILVRVTATRDCIGVVDYAIDLATKLGAKVLLLDVVHDPFGQLGWNLPIPSLSEEYVRLLAEVRATLGKIVERETRRGFHVESLVREGDPVEVITAVVKEKNIDLLVLPAHHEDRLEHFFFGKANEKLMRQLPCSILLARTSEVNVC
jgi:nucleotide-binding universal stress UspA family protein